MINRCYQWDLVQSCELPNGQTWRRELAGAPCGRNPDWWRREWWCPWHDWIDLCSNCPPPGRGHPPRYWRTAGARLSPFLDCSWPRICQQINTVMEILSNINASLHVFKGLVKIRNVVITLHLQLWPTPAGIARRCWRHGRTLWSLFWVWQPAYRTN